MARPRSKIDITCQNPECKYFFVESGKDIIKRGKNRAGLPNLVYSFKYCCGVYLDNASDEG